MTDPNISCAEFERKLPPDAQVSALIEAVLDCDPPARLPYLEAIMRALRCGSPLPPFMSVMSEAKDWAVWASQSERDAYMLSCFQASSPERQAAFLNHVQIEERAVA